jgi:ribosomal protein S18 acetylase RimI-like enzyme
MPAKTKKNANAAAAPNGKGRTKAQREADELDHLAVMAEEAYSHSHESRKASTAVTAARKVAAVQQQQRRQPTQQEIEQMMMLRQEEHRLAVAAAVYVNSHSPLAADKTAWFEVGPGKFLRYEQFTEGMIKPVVDLFTDELSEPYSAFTYQYFLSNWSDLGIIAYGVEAAAAPAADVKGDMVGCVVSKVSRKGPGQPLRGYIAMLAVRPTFRGMRIGQKLVRETVALMKQKEVEEVGLETPVNNAHALTLYTTLGFVKTKFLGRYYLDGSDAVRLKLWLRSPFPAAKPGEGSE